MEFLNRRNPISVLVFFICIVTITMLSNHIFVIIISFFSSVILCIITCGTKEFFKKLFYVVPLIIFSIIFNVAFSKIGVTHLFNIFNRSVTLEAIVYGAFYGLSISSLILWFCVLSEVLTSDKIVYIFGRTLPKIAMILAVTLGFIPKIKKQYNAINDSLIAVGAYRVGLYKKLKLKFLTLSTLVSYSIESSVVMSESMTCRGFDLKGKRSFGRYSINIFDVFLMVFSALITAFFLWVFNSNLFVFYYFPMIKNTFETIEYILGILLLLAMNLVSLLTIFERLKWTYCVSKI